MAESHTSPFVRPPRSSSSLINCTLSSPVWAARHCYSSTPVIRSASYTKQGSSPRSLYFSQSLTTLSLVCHLAPPLFGIVPEEIKVNLPLSFCSLRLSSAHVALIVTRHSDLRDCDGFPLHTGRLPPSSIMLFWLQRHVSVTSASHAHVQPWTASYWEISSVSPEVKTVAASKDFYCCKETFHAVFARARFPLTVRLCCCSVSASFQLPAAFHYLLIMSDNHQCHLCVRKETLEPCSWFGFQHFLTSLSVIRFCFWFKKRCCEALESTPIDQETIHNHGGVLISLLSGLVW